jgi:hypothetical protein
MHILYKRGRASPRHSLWKQRRFQVQATVTLLLTVLTLSILARFLSVIDMRPGVVLDDPVLSLFTAHDVTWLTFSLIYVGLIAGLIILIRTPRQMLVALQAYTLFVLIRMLCMYVVPLDPPPGMISLKDPLVEYFGTGKVLSRDLFFSGHTGTLFLLGLSLQSKWIKISFFSGAALVGLCVLFQHVHYTIDVIAAPAFAYAAYRIVALLHIRPWYGRMD